MDLLLNKAYIKVYLKNNFFNKHKDLLKEIVNEAFFTRKDKNHFRRNGSLNNWAFDFRLPLLNSIYNRPLFEIIAEYLSSLNYETIALKGVGAMPFISLNQYAKINNIIVLRDSPKSYGFRHQIEGGFDQNKPICIIDDIINSGNNVLSAAEILNKNNATANKYFCLADFKWGAKKININLIDSILEIQKNA
jgi:hypothetical protein